MHSGNAIDHDGREGWEYSTATTFGSLDFLIRLYHKRSLMSQATNPGVEWALTHLLNEWATKTNWGAQDQMVVAGSWGTWQNPPHTLVPSHTHHLVPECFLIPFVLFYLLSDAEADCGGKRQPFHVIYIFFFFSPFYRKEQLEAAARYISDYEVLPFSIVWGKGFSSTWGKTAR